MDNGLFSNNPDKIDLKQKANLVKFDLNTEDFYMDVVKKRKERLFSVRTDIVTLHEIEAAREAERAESDRESSDESEISDNSEDDFVLDEAYLDRLANVGIDIGERAKGEIVASFDDDRPFDVVQVGNARQFYESRDSKFYMESEVRKAQERLCQTHSKQVTREILRYMKNKYSESDMYNACVFVCVYLANKYTRKRDYYEDYLGEEISQKYWTDGVLCREIEFEGSRRMTYSDLTNELILEQIGFISGEGESQRLKQNVEMKYVRMKETCIMYATNTLAGQLFRDGGRTHTLERCCKELFKLLKIHFEPMKFQMYYDSLEENVEGVDLPDFD
jgi:hypothetical protein